MRVRVVGRDEGSALDVGGEGTVPVRIAVSDGRVDAVVPILVMGEPRGFSGKTFRQVGQQERIVGVTTIDIGAAEKLFPGGKIVAIQLNGNDPLPGARVAWERLGGGVSGRGGVGDGEKELGVAGWGGRV